MIYVYAFILTRCKDDITSYSLKIQCICTYILCNIIIKQFSQFDVIWKYSISLNFLKIFTKKFFAVKTFLCSRVFFVSFQPSQILSSSPHQSLSSGSNPPTPPTRRNSLRPNNNGNGNNGNNGERGSHHHSGETFESRFANLFKSPQYLPPPEPFTQCAKTYPSRSQQQSCKLGILIDI